MVAAAWAAAYMFGLAVAHTGFGCMAAGQLAWAAFAAAVGRS